MDMYKKEGSFAGHKNGQILKDNNKKNLWVLYGIIIVVLFVIGIILQSEIISVVLISIVTIFFSLKMSRPKALSILKVVIGLLLFQNTLVGIFAKLVDSPAHNISFLLQVPTLIVFIVGTAILLTKKLNRLDFIGFIIIGLLVFSFVISSGSLIGKINYFRNYIFFYFLYLVAMHAFSSKNEFINFARFVTIIGIVSIGFSIITYFLPDQFWISIGIEKLYIAKGSPLEGGFDSTQDRFRSSIFSIGVFRNGSFMMEPVNYGYFILGAWFLSLVHFKDNLTTSIKFNRWTPLFVIGLVLSFGKGAWLYGGAVLAVVFIHKTIKAGLPIKKSSVFNLILLLSTFAIIIFSFWYNNYFGGPTNTHFLAIDRTLANVFKQPWGYGLGTGGNFGDESVHDWLSAGGETGLLAMAYQMGIHFVILFVLLGYLIGKTILLRGNYAYNLIFAYAIFIAIILFIFQENTFTPQCISLFIIPCAFVDYKNYDKVLLKP